ncbi:MAG: hypothetical protein Q7T33_04530 [Dehalococcoidia bacterium]|nr:hypothetical protein [Dehalococcoidia bacterium]
MTLRYADPPSLFRPALPPGLISGDILERARAIVKEQSKPYRVEVPLRPVISVLAVAASQAATFKYGRCHSPPALLKAATEYAHFLAGDELNVAGDMGYFEAFGGSGRVLITSDVELTGVALWERGQFWVSAEQDAESSVRTVAHEVHHLHYTPLHPGATYEQQEAAASDYASAFVAHHGARIMAAARLQVADPPLSVLQR